MKILGISAHYHDSAAALVVDGVPVCAAQEERLSRRKNDAGFPLNAIEWCLEHAKIEPDQLERYRQLFRQSTALRFIVAVKEIRVDGREARVQVEGAMRYHDTKTDKDVLTDYSSRARLAEGPLGWRILEIK